MPALAPRLGLPEPAARRLLDAAVALRLATRNRKGVYRLGALGAALIDNPGVAAMIAHHRMLYEDLRDPVGLLKGETGRTQLARFWPYDAPSDGSAAYSTLMAASQAMVAEEVLASYRVGRHRCLLDVGGGDGSFLVAVAARAPALRLALFDLAPVCELAPGALRGGRDRGAGARGCRRLPLRFVARRRRPDLIVAGAARP